MDGAIHTLEIEDTPFDVPIGVAGNLVIAVRSPRSANSVTVMIGPNVADFTPTVEGLPAGVEIRNVLALGSTDETVTGLMQIGDAASRHFSMNGVEYRITLQDIVPTMKDGQPAITYHFLVQVENSGSVAKRSAARQAILKDHEAAFQSNDVDAVRRSATAYADSLRAELCPSLDDFRLLADVLNRMIVVCRQLGDRAGETATYSRIIEELDIPHVAAQEHVANALYARAKNYKADESYDLMMADLSQIDQRYAHLSYLAAMTLVAKSLIMKADSLRELHRFDEMRHAAATVVDRYGSHTEEALVQQVAEAQRLFQMMDAAT